MDIGTTIRKLRLLKGLTQEQLADALGVTPQTISRWETSVNYPDVIMLPLIAGLFNVTTDYILNVGGHSIMKTIESERLIIREWKDSDAGDLFLLSQGANRLISYLNIPGSIDDSLETIRMWRKYQEMFPILLKSSGKLIGVIGLVDVNRHAGYREIEYYISHEYHGNGYTSEAVKLILEYGFCELNMLIAAASIEKSNSKSISIVEKNGFMYEGTLRKYGRDLSDRMRYSITKDEWER